MYYGKIRKMDISNGPGIRVSLFTSGCEKHCPGCFNSETWDFNYGKEYTVDTRTEILKLCEPEYIAGLSILGGEPLHPNNIRTIADLITKFKSRYRDKTVWIWTGYTFEELKSRMSPDMLAILVSADVIIDGPFVETLKDLSLKWRGSSNQRIWKRDGVQWIMES